LGVGQGAAAEGVQEAFALMLKTFVTTLRFA
jgi:hypothetical protein